MIIISAITVILLSQHSFAVKNILPVFLLDYDGAMNHVYFDRNPFGKLTSTNFIDVINTAIKNCETIIIFVEDNLCTEDLSTRDHFGTPYYHVHNDLKANKAKYFPAVENPFKTLEHILKPKDSNVFHISTGTKWKLTSNSQHIYVYFLDEKNETRTQKLRKHDLIMNDVYIAVHQLKPGPIAAFYTGKINSVLLHKIEFVPIKPDPVPRDMGVMVASTGALFRFSGVYATTTKRRSTFHQLPMVAEETWTRKKLSTKMAYTDFEIEFNFSFEDKQWTLDNVALLEGGEEVGRTEMGVGAPWNCSFVCGEPLVIVNTRDGSAITISQYQVQPRIPHKGEVTPVEVLAGHRLVFGESVSCGPYFSTTIISCLCLTIMCLGIIMYAVVWLMNCHTNDRYEDPQGKPLAIVER